MSIIVNDEAAIEISRDILLRDLENYIAEERDKILFKEVLSCFESKSFRAAFIINWIMIVESLRAKFEEIAYHDSKVKREVIDKLKLLENEKKATDKFLIEESKKYGWIDEEGQVKLLHLYELRGAYAHPLNLAPLDYETDCAIRQGVDLVLSKPTLLSYGFIDSLINSIFNEHHFMENDSEEIKVEAKKYIKRINPNVYKYLFKKLIENIKLIFSDSGKIRYIRRGREFLYVLLTEHIGNNADQWEIKKKINEGNDFLSKIILNIEIWRIMPVDVATIVFNYEIEPPPEDNGEVNKPHLMSMKKIYNLKKEALLNERQLDKYNQTLMQYNSRMKKFIGIPLEEYVFDIIDELKSYDWYTQNPAIELINEIEDLQVLDNSTLVNLGRNILQASNGGARSAESFIKCLDGETISNWPPALIEGIFLETIINERSTLRFKKFLIEMIDLICNLETVEFDKILKSALSLFPKELTSKNVKTYYDHLTKKYLDKLKSLEKLHPNSEYLNEFIEYFIEVKKFEEE